MCCFAQPIQSVHATKIFARLSDLGSQFLAYQMTYKSKTPNAMILPLPTRLRAQEGDVRFISLDGYADLFKDLDDGFPYIRPWPRVDSPTGAITSRSAGILEVEEVGDYVASFVPTVADFDRLDPKFVIPESTWDLIPEYGDYGFAVFQLDKLSAKPHPMAFEFPTRHRDRVFYPTIHIHDGEVHETENFDHELYVQHPLLDAAVGDYLNRNEVDPVTKLVRSDRIASKFTDVDASAGIIDADLLVHRQRLRGQLPNTDHWVSLTASVLPSRSQKFGPARYIPWVLAGGAIAWLIHRRHQLQQSADLS